MSLQLYYGSSQSNRTAFIYEEVLKEAELHPDKRYILLVPEQASLITQKEMIVKSHNHALFNIDVLTFNRLAYRVFEDLKEYRQSFTLAAKSEQKRLCGRNEVSDLRIRPI